MEQGCAILVRKTRLTESSLIVTWMTQEHGLVRTVAKGARAPKSRFAGQLDLFFQCQISFQRARRGDLHTLLDVHLHALHEGLRKDYPRLALGSYFIQLMELALEPDAPAPELYDLLLRAIGHLDAHPASRRALLHFEKELARLLGVNDPEHGAATALSRVYHRLPKDRADLLDRMN
jgi:DNA repair protein RecO (recombination protein O)